MFRVFTCHLIALCLAAPALAVTVPPDAGAFLIPDVVASPGIFADLLSGYPIHRQIRIEPQREILSHLALLFWLILVATGGVITVTQTLWGTPAVQASRVAFARSCTRWIIARNPFERWDERWSLRSRRASSASASTARASRAERPL